MNRVRAGLCLSSVMGPGTQHRPRGPSEDIVETPGAQPALTVSPELTGPLPVLRQVFLCRSSGILLPFNSLGINLQGVCNSKPHMVTFLQVSSLFEIRQIPSPWGRACQNPAFHPAFPKDGSSPPSEVPGEHNGQAPYVILMSTSL